MRALPGAWLFSVVALVLTAGWAAPAFSGSPAVLIRDALLVSPNGAAPRPGVDILVEGGVIRQVGDDLSHPEARIIDAAGKTVLPGLIDCHSHLNSVPGADLRGDAPEALEVARKLQLRAYLAAGVTTVLDAAAPVSVLRDMRAYVERSNLGPRIEGLAPFLTPEHGYFADAELRAGHYSDLWSPIGADLEEIDAHFRAAAPFAPVGVKVTIEDGFGPLPVWPLFDDAALAKIRERAAAHGAPVFVHAMETDEYARGLLLEPTAYVHAPASPLDDETLRALRESGARVITTLAVYDMSLLIVQRERMDDPWLRMLVPAEQIATAESPEHSKQMLAAIYEANAPGWVPQFVFPLLASFDTSSQAVARLQAAMSAVKTMHDGGVPLVMGSDMGNWPLFTSLFHGVGSIRELELLEQAGIPREEVLAAATTRAAALLGRSRDLGAVEVGSAADLVIANRNPLEAGMAALRDLAYVMKDGEIRTPAAWMSEPARAESEGGDDEQHVGNVRFPPVR